MSSNPPGDAAASGEGEGAACGEGNAAPGLDLNSASASAATLVAPGEPLWRTLNDYSEDIVSLGAGGSGVSNESDKKDVEGEGNLEGTEVAVEATGAGGDGDGEHVKELETEQKDLERIDEVDGEKVTEAVVSNGGNGGLLTVDAKFAGKVDAQEGKRDVEMAKDSIDFGAQNPESATVDEMALNKGNAVNAEVGTDIDVCGTGTAAEGDVQVGEQEAPKKRGRGRPRLSDIRHTPPLGKNEQTREPESSQRRRRGRPPRSAVKDTQPASEVKDEDVHAQEEQSSAKRKRVGRPKLSKMGNAENFEPFIGENVQVGEPAPSLGRSRGRPRRSAVEFTPDSRYLYPFQHETEDKFAVPDLVWGKVRSHPWWPGQIFDASDASDIALDIQKKDHFLVAYFGDKTFAWCDESQLKPFQTYFAQMEKQSVTNAFLTAVNESLVEVSRRVELGMVCSCFTDEAYAVLKDKKVDNAGIQEGTLSSTVDKSWVMEHFEPARLLEYVQTLAQLPHGGADRLELVVAKAQLKVFHHSKGYPEVPTFVLGGGLEDDDPSSLSGKVESGNYNIEPLTPVPSKKEKSRGRGGSTMEATHVLMGGRKQKGLSELIEEKIKDDLADVEINQCGREPSSLSSVQKCKVADSDYSDSGTSKKKRLDSLGDFETKSETFTHKKELKVGERMRRVAGMMSGSPPMLISKDETAKRSSSQVTCMESASMEGPQSQMGNLGVEGVALNEYSSPTEMLSQLCLVATDPLEGYSFLSTIINFFSDFRYWMVSSSLEDVKAWEIVKGERRKRRSVNLKLEDHDPDAMQDSYWTDIIVSEDLVPDTQKRKGKSQSRKEKKSRTVPSLPLDFMSIVEEQLKKVGSTSPSVAKELEADLRLGNSDDKTEEVVPTELVITFAESDTLPTVDDLITIFGRYGPLRNGEAEVLEEAKLAKVVFKRRSDAEEAYSRAGKQNIFGQVAVSYRLRNLESPSKASSNDESKEDSLPANNGASLEGSVVEDAGLRLDNVHMEANGSSI